MTRRYPEITNQVTPITHGAFNELPGLGTRQAEEAAGRRTGKWIMAAIAGATFLLGTNSYFNGQHDTSVESGAPAGDAQTFPATCKFSAETQIVVINPGTGAGTDYVLQRIKGIDTYNRDSSTNCHDETFSAINVLNPGIYELRNGSSVDAGQLILPAGVTISFVAGPTAENN